jgi:hypothetical protein
MDLRDLTHTERVVYEAAQAEARAQRWRIEADLRERDGQDATFCRKQQQQYEREAADRWRHLAALKEDKRALEGMD